MTHKIIHDTGIGGEDWSPNENQKPAEITFDKVMAEQKKANKNREIVEHVPKEEQKTSLPKKPVEEIPPVAEDTQVSAPSTGVSPVDEKIQELKRLSRKISLLKEVIEYAASCEPDPEFPDLDQEIAKIVEMLLSKVIIKFEENIK